MERISAPDFGPSGVIKVRLGSYVGRVSKEPGMFERYSMPPQLQVDPVRTLPNRADRRRAKRK